MATSIYLGLLVIFICVPPYRAWPTDLGCYIHSDFYFKTKPIIQDPDVVTIEFCIEECRFSGERFAAVRKGFECYCGDEFTESQSGTCNTTCYGNRNQICGGMNAVNVYTVCENGTYKARDNTCSEKCNSCLIPPCHQASGDCTDGKCQDYFIGTKCNGCKPRMYGTDCSYPCGNCVDDICKDGSCTSAGCKDGFAMPTCKCGHCKDGPVCDDSTKNCPGDCQLGFYGQKCNEKCSFLCLHSICDKNTGSCIDCHDGNYGRECKKTCPENCLDVTCDKDLGSCFGCKIKTFYGEKCNITCGKCSSSECEQETGKCPAECLPGYTGHKCVNECQNGTGRINCTSFCINCKFGCNPANGKCNPTSCKDGKCSYTSCTNGKCSYTSCKDGFKGIYCDEIEEEGNTIPGNDDKTDDGNGGDDDDTDNTIIIAFGLGAGGFLVIIIVVVCVVKKRKNKSSVQHFDREHNDIPLMVDIKILKESEPGLPQRDMNGTQQKQHPHEADDVYENRYLSKEVKIKDIKDYIRRNMKNENISREFKSLPHGFKALTADGESKDRYKNIKPYDNNLVKLIENDGTPGADYINASHINGYARRNKFIAAQGPKPITSSDHWRMIWEQTVSTVVMLTNLVECGKDKCNQYWPDSEEGYKVYEKLRIDHKEESDKEGYVVRTFELKEVENKTNKRKVTQFHFTDWPDKGVPGDPSKINTFLKYVIENCSDETNPIVVHCSAGVGRTGTFIALDILTEQAGKEKMIDVYQCVNLLRDQRVNMVQTEEQYKFIYQAMYDALCTDQVESANDEDSNVKAVSTEPNPTYDNCPEISKQKEKVPVIPLMVDLKIEKESKPGLPQRDMNGTQQNQHAHEADKVIENRYLSKELKIKDIKDYMGRNTEHANINSEFKSLPHGSNPVAASGESKDRYTNIEPYDYNRVKLIENDGTLGADYINASPINDKCNQYWPDSEEGYKVYEKLRIDHKEESDKDGYVVRTFELKEVENITNKRKVTQFHFTDWPDKGVPGDTSKINTFLKHIRENCSDETNPIVVHGSAGVGRTGTFIAMDILTDQAGKEHIIDVYQCVNLLRDQRVNMVQTEEQYRFIYQAMHDALSISQVEIANDEDSNVKEVSTGANPTYDNCPEISKPVNV